MSAILNAKTGEPNAMRSKDVGIIRWAASMLKGWWVGEARGT